MASIQDELPRPPPSPFVARLREEVSSAREPEAEETSLRGTSRLGSLGSCGSRGVRFADEGPVMPSPKICLRFKGTAAKPFKVESVSTDTTIRDLKMLCQSTCSLEPDQQRMLHKGKILHDSQTIEEAGLSDGATLFLVKGTSGRPESRDARERERQKELERSRQRRELEAAALLAGPPCLDCGVNPGRLQTDGMCSICFREQVVKENRLLKKRREEAKRREQEAAREEERRKKEEEERLLRSQQDATRCYACHKKIGLTGFLCDCGYHFCSGHRYAEDHACTFDHKARGREILARHSAAGLKD